MSDTYKEGQPPEIKEISKVLFNDTVQKWIVRLNQIIDILNVVENNTEHPNDTNPFYKFGFMSVSDKNYLDFLHNHIKDGIPDVISPAYNNNFNVFSSLVDTTELKYKKSNRFIEFHTVGTASTNTEISINHDSNDVIEIEASTEITLDFNSGSNVASKPMYSEKIVYVRAIENIIVNYESDNDWHFVNNGIHPNVGIMPIPSTEDPEEVKKYDESTFLNAGNSLVLKFIFIGNRTLISVIDNTQLVENYNNENYNE